MAVTRARSASQIGAGADSSDPKSQRRHRSQLFSSAGPPLLQRSLTAGLRLAGKTGRHWGNSPVGSAYWSRLGDGAEADGPESTHPRIFSSALGRRDETWLDDLRAKMKEAFRSLAPSIHLVVVRPRRKSRTFRYESVYPRLQHGMRQVPVARFQLWTGSGRARYFAAFGVHLHQATDFMSKRLDDGRSVRLVLHQLQVNVWPLAAEDPNSQQRSRKIQAIANLIQQVTIRPFRRLDLSHHII